MDLSRFLRPIDDPEYNRHLSNMHKIRVGHKGLRELWIPKTQGARVDLRDCEVYNLAMAHGPALCGMLPSAEQMLAQIAAAQQAAHRPISRGIETPDGREFLATRRH